MRCFPPFLVSIAVTAPMPICRASQFPNIQCGYQPRLQGPTVFSPRVGIQRKWRHTPPATAVARPSRLPRPSSPPGAPRSAPPRRRAVVPIGNRRRGARGPLPPLHRPFVPTSSLDPNPPHRPRFPLSPPTMAGIDLADVLTRSRAIEARRGGRPPPRRRWSWRRHWQQHRRRRRQRRRRRRPLPPPPVDGRPARGRVAGGRSGGGRRGRPLRGRRPAAARRGHPPPPPPAGGPRPRVRATGGRRRARRRGRRRLKV